MADGRYWVTYVSEREHATGCDSVKIERVTDETDAANALANEFMHNALDVMKTDASVTRCIVHVYDCESGRFLVHRTLRHAFCDGGLGWLSLDE